MVSGALRGAVAPLSRVVGGSFGALGIRPSHITWASLVVAAFGAFTIASGHLIGGALVIFIAAGFDFVDGAIARTTGQVTKVGGYLDSLLDRFVDALFLLAILWHLDDRLAWLVGGVALFGSITTSFARARVFQDTVPDPRVWHKDILERTERYAILLPAVFVQGFIDRAEGTFDLLFWAVAVLAVGSVLTVIQRMRTATRVLARLDEGGAS